MTSRPILFSAPMVRALLNGSKTQTRRAFKADRMTWDANGRYTTHAMLGGELVATGSGPFNPNSWLHYCPYGQLGDQLWVRETWRGIVKISAPWEGTTYGVAHYVPDQEHCHHIEYAATFGEGAKGWRPSIHMPRWASRITLEVTAVRVERLQDITEADAIAEGCTKNHNGYFWGGPHAVSGLKQMATAVSAYRDLWQSINGPASWAANPWVWVVEFKAVKP